MPEKLGLEGSCAVWAVQVWLSRQREFHKQRHWRQKNNSGTFDLVGAEARRYHNRRELALTTTR